MPQVSLDVLYVTFQDERYPPTNILTGSCSSFVCTTGGFPHEILIGTKASSADVNSVRLQLQAARRIRIERGVDMNPTVLTVIDERELDRGDSPLTSVQTVVIDMQQPVAEAGGSPAGKDLRFLKLTILSGWDDFVGIFSIEAEGEESQQRIITMEKKAEIEM